VLWVAGEFQDVELGEAGVLEEFPGGVGGAFGAGAAGAGGDVFEGGGPVYVGVAPVEEIGELFAKRFIGHGGGSLGMEKGYSEI